VKNPFTRNRRICLITDRRISGLSLSAMVRQSIRSGIKVIQIREKDMPKKDLYKEMLRIRQLTAQQNVTLIVNDHVDIALATNADGVHLGQDDMPVREARKILGTHSLIGISAHTIHQAVQAEHEGADYIGFGPVFFTDTKDAGTPRGIPMLKKVRRSVRVPLVAIGGITSENAREVLDAGADAVAVASAILSGSIRDTIKKFSHLV
jgi:thiamine-phosphate pyrophosphorylase